MNITSYGNNGSIKPRDLNAVSPVQTKTEYELLQQLQHAEAVNAELEKQIEAQTKNLETVVETNTKFISILSHDLRSPFQSIIGALDLLKENYREKDFKDFEKYIEIASDSASRTFSLLESLLTWTVSQNKEKTFNPVKINLFELIENEIESVIALARQKQITMIELIDPKLFVTADLQMVKTILRNLIGNAIKYTNPGGEITLSAHAKTRFVEIEVKDNGIGISLSVQRELFNRREYQSTAGISHEYGSGFGLKFCKEFVEMHGGIIWIESDVDKGSKFKFTLPRYI